MQPALSCCHSFQSPETNPTVLILLYKGSSKCHRPYSVSQYFLISLSLFPGPLVSRLNPCTVLPDLPFSCHQISRFLLSSLLRPDRLRASATRDHTTSIYNFHVPFFFSHAPHAHQLAPSPFQPTHTRYYVPGPLAPILNPCILLPDLPFSLLPLSSNPVAC